MERCPATVHVPARPCPPRTFVLSGQGAIVRGSPSWRGALPLVPGPTATRGAGQAGDVPATRRSAGTRSPALARGTPPVLAKPRLPAPRPRVPAHGTPALSSLHRPRPWSVFRPNHADGPSRSTRATSEPSATPVPGPCSWFSGRSRPLRCRSPTRARAAVRIGRNTDQAHARWQRRGAVHDRPMTSLRTPRTTIERPGADHARTIRKNLAADVRQAREDAGLSQRRLAREAGVSHATLSAVEGGDARPQHRSAGPGRSGIGDAPERPALSRNGATRP